ncbi:MAG: hypothetical protein ACRENP_02305 [Longimicrobiales bacterium]
MTGRRLRRGLAYPLVLFLSSYVGYALSWGLPRALSLVSYGWLRWRLR